MEKISLIISAIGALTLCTNVVIEVLKHVFEGFPTRIAAFVVSILLTVTAFFAYTCINNIPVVWYMVVGAVMTGFFVSLSAQVGFDKVKEIILKYFGGSENGKIH